MPRDLPACDRLYLKDFPAVASAEGGRDAAWRAPEALGDDWLNAAFDLRQGGAAGEEAGLRREQSGREALRWRCTLAAGHQPG